MQFGASRSATKKSKLQAPGGCAASTCGARSRRHRHLGQARSEGLRNLQRMLSRRSCALWHGQELATPKAPARAAILFAHAVPAAQQKLMIRPLLAYKPCGAKMNSKLLRHWQFEEYGWSKVPNLGLTCFRSVGLEARFAAKSGHVPLGVPVS